MADKYAIFDRFSKSLERCVPGYRGQYACPLSMRSYVREAIGTRDLTEEHCIPGGLGENVTVLTARHANNTAGTAIDAHLERMIACDEVFRNGVGILSGSFEYGGHRVGVDFTREISVAGTHDHFRISADHRRSDLRQVVAMEAFAMQAAASKNLDDEMTFRLHPHCFGNQRLARVALLKAGYLLLFRQFGYSYILDDLLTPVRQQIAYPEQDVVPLERVVYEMNPKDYSAQSLLVTRPEEFKAYIVGIKLQKHAHATPRYFGVVLPAMPWTYDVWANAESRTFGAAHVRDADYILNPRPFIWP